MPYAAFAAPLWHGPWVASAAFTPELLMRANWQYVDAPGTAGASYGLQTNEDQIIALRSSAGLARSLGTKWMAGVTLGLIYNTNNLNAPYIFQQQTHLAGLKVLLHLNAAGVGWNGSAGVGWKPSSSLSVGLAWKSGTSIRTTGSASGTASAQFAALGIAADPTFQYHAQVETHLPQAFDAAVTWKQSQRLTWSAEFDFAAWGQAFQQLPVTLTGGTNATINSVAGSTTLQDGVPLHWNNQEVVRLGVESPVAEHWMLRGGYSYMTNPVPAATLLPLTAAIMQQSVALGTGWTRGHWRVDAAYQMHLPASESVGKSSLLAGEYDNSRVRLMLQSVTISAQRRF
jgi:long-subunit fatty acid transport protein